MFIIINYFTIFVMFFCKLFEKKILFSILPLSFFIPLSPLVFCDLTIYNFYLKLTHERLEVN